MRRAVIVLLFSASLFAQDAKKPDAPAPTFTLEPMKQWVPHCKEGYEPWYEPKGNGCPSSWNNGPAYRDRRMKDGPVKPEDVECRPVGSEPKLEYPTACAV